MVSIERTSEVMTPEQAADYLKVNRETVYRYIRQGELVALKGGRSYRIPKPNLDRLLSDLQCRQGFTAREYTAEEIAGFLRDDQLDDQARAIVERFSKSMDGRTPRNPDLNVPVPR